MGVDRYGGKCHDGASCGEKWGVRKDTGTPEETETSAPLGPRNGSGCCVAAFRGTFEHSLDDRGRVAVPARYRHTFVDGGVLTPGADGCLELYPVQAFEDTAQDFTADGANMPRGRRVRRGLYARSFDVELDKQGRILVPQALREAAALSGSVVLAGRRECLEIWAQERWQAEITQVEQGFSADLEAQRSDAP